MFRLWLAFIWLLVGIGFIVYHAVTADPRWRIGSTGLSLGWAALVIAVYNLARWWVFRVALGDRHVVDRIRLRRAQMLAEAPPQKRGEPDPNFNFTDDKKRGVTEREERRAP